MNKQEAIDVLRKELEPYRQLGHKELQKRIGDDCHFEVTAPSGVEYQVEVHVLWESVPEGNVLVMGSVDDGGFRAFFPLCETFVMEPVADKLP